MRNASYKRIRKTLRRPYKSSNRHFRKSRYRRSRAFKRFARRVNAVAEKKMFSINLAQYVIPRFDAALGLDNGAGGIINLAYLALVPGVGEGQRIGSKVFVRYVRFKLTLSPVDATSWTAGDVWVYHLIEKRPGSLAGLRYVDMFLNPPHLFNPTNLKHSVSKCKLYRRRVNNAVPSAAGVFPADSQQNVYFSKKLKIMKEVFVTNGIINIPDHYIGCFYAQQPFSYNGAVGNSRILSGFDVTYTDL